MNHQVVIDYTNVNTENSSVCVYVRARPPDQGWTLEDDDASIEDKFQNPLQATLAGLSPKSASGGVASTPQATNSAFISNFLDNPKKISIKDPSSQTKHHGEINFSFDRVFWTECSQEEIFQAVAKPQVDNILNGFNGCCFAYGQTGSGKTYSMFGEGEGNSRGMIPRCMEEIFSQLEIRAKDKEVAVVVSFLEIYCDQVRDLGEAYMSHGEREVDGMKTTSDIYRQMKSTRAESFHRRSKNGHRRRSNIIMGNGSVWDSYPSMDLKIHEDVQGNVFVKIPCRAKLSMKTKLVFVATTLSKSELVQSFSRTDALFLRHTYTFNSVISLASVVQILELSLIPVTTLQEVLDIISIGLKLRATHETKMNQVSSRSHTVFTGTVVQKDPFTEDSITGILNLVDLAGSERLKKSASEGQRKTEALHINSSLTALGKVVMALDPSSGLTHVPYRDSKLTRLLQNSLGGNSFTVVLATVHPISRFYEECLSTLQFANRCRSVHNNPRVNKLDTAAAADPRKVRKLQEEIASLRMRLANGGGPSGMAGARGVYPNARVMAVLAQIGLTGVSELPDGSIRLPDGRIVGEVSVGGEQEPEKTCGKSRRGTDFGASRTTLQGLPANVRMMVATFEAEARGCKKKVQEYKNEMAEMNDQLKARRAAFAQSENDSRRRDAEMAGRLAVAKASLCEVQEAAARTKKEQLAAVLAESQVLLRRQRRQLLKIRGSQSAIEIQDNKWEERVNREEHIRHAKSMQALEFSKEVEAENLRQQCQQLAQLELRTREQAEGKLERYRQYKAREVRELSVELLLLYEHTLSLHNSPEEAFLPTTIIDCSRSKTPTNNKPTPPQLPQAASLLQLRHFPRLAKLISAKHEDPEQLGQSPSESFIPGAGGGGRCIAIRKMRPKSAGASSTSSRKHFASSASVSMLNRTGPSPSTKQRHDRMGGCNTTGEERLIASGTLRPMSAPGRRRPANNVGREEVAIGRIFHGETCTGTHELSRKGLIGLVEKLRERLRRLEGGHNRRCREKNDSWQSLDTHNGEEGNLDTYSGSKKENGETDGGAQALLKHQARRYNDLRTAYESLWRRLECRDETRRPGSGGNNWRLKHTKSDLLRRGIVAPDSVRARGAPESDVGKRPCCGDGLLSRSIGIQ